MKVVCCLATMALGSFLHLVSASLEQFEQCPAKEVADPGGCAAHWGPRPNRSETQIVAVNVFRSTLPADQQRWIEYHLLMGVTMFVLVDNTCNDADFAQTVRALEPYVSAGIVTHVTDFRCVDLPNIKKWKFPRQDYGCELKNTGQKALERLNRWKKMANSTIPFASCERCIDEDPKAAMLSCALYRLKWLRHLRTQSLFLALDDDEYVVIDDQDPSRAPITLGSLQNAMEHRKLCSFPLVWKIFGTGGHVCQPHGGLIKNFLSRTGLPSEMTTPEMTRDMLRLVELSHYTKQNPVFGMAKTIFLGSAIGCSNHVCEQCPHGHWCGEKSNPSARYCPERITFHNETFTHDNHLGLRAHGIDLNAHNVYINHYAYQSKQFWERKKRRGRTAGFHAQRGGDVHPMYDVIHDETGWRMMQRRVEAVRVTKLRRCLTKMLLQKDLATQ